MLRQIKYFVRGGLVSFMLIIILVMINPFPHFNPNLFVSGSFLVGNTTLLQAHTTLHKAACSHHSSS